MHSKLNMKVQDNMVTDIERTRLIPKPSTGQCFTLRDFKLEAALMVLFFGWHLTVAIMPNQLLKQTCLTRGYNITDCNKFIINNGTQEIEREVQPIAAQILTKIDQINFVVPAILSLFLGAWSDKFGRKNVICGVLCGFSLSLVSFCLISFIAEDNSSISPWTYLLCYLPMIFSGGYPSLLVASICFISDLSTESSRSFRLTVLEVVTFIGIFLGVASSSFILKLANPTTVFFILATCATLALLFAIAFIDESPQVPTDLKFYEQLGQLFKPKPVLEMMTTFVKPRLHNERKILWCLTIALTLTYFTIFGTFNLYYLFVREKFQWSLREATLFDSASTITAVFGSICGLRVLKKIMKLSDSSIAMLSMTSALIEALVKATAQTPTQIYIAPAIGLLKNLEMPMCRSLIANFIPKNEIGKVFSFITSFALLSGMLLAPLYTFVYSKTFTFFAGAYFLITASFCLINLTIILVIKNLKH